MAIYHFEAKVITRGTGRSVCAAAAYASCSQIYNDYDGVQHDYTKKRGNAYSEIFLPPSAPQEWKNREALWNAVEAAEKSKDSRLARELIVALPVELGIDDWKEMLQDFVLRQCVDRTLFFIKYSHKPLGIVFYFIGLLGIALTHHIYIKLFEYRKRKNAFDVIELAREIIEQSK